MAMGGKDRCADVHEALHGAQGGIWACALLQGVAWPGIQGGQYLPRGRPRVSLGAQNELGVGQHWHRTKTCRISMI